MNDPNAIQPLKGESYANQGLKDTGFVVRRAGQSARTVGFRTTLRCRLPPVPKVTSP